MAAEIGVMIVALGTPDEPTPGAVRRYLREFLTDRRIIEMNPVAWRMILETMILPRRGRASAEKYASVWTEEGSPLLVHTRRQTDLIAGRLAETVGDQVQVKYAMRYGTPAVGTVMDEFYAAGVRRLLVVPAFAQYSQTTVGSIYDAVARHMLSRRDQFDLRLIRSIANDPGYIAALAARVEDHWDQAGRPDFAAGDVLLTSFHGIPEAMAAKGDPYDRECGETAARLRDRLGLTEAECQLTYQSKFGPAPWLRPATIDRVGELGRAGVGRVDVICPGFIADCLETLEEIGILNREVFTQAGGGKLELIPCLNELPAWIEAWSDVITSHLQGWV
jgi:ferrochelatase